MEKMTRKEKGLYLLKRYGYLVIFGVCAIVLIVALAVSSGKKTVKVVDNPNDQQPVNNATMTFGLPVLNLDIIKSFSNTALQYNETLNQYEAHLATDFACEAGADVMSVCDGTVVEVGNSYLKGNYIVVNHGNNLKSVYASLDDNMLVKVGQNVNKGEVIGKVANSAFGELKQGTHLHFEMLDNDKRIDPAGYLTLENK